jgi:hypothetical protein
MPSIIILDLAQETHIEPQTIRILNNYFNTFYEAALTLAVCTEP